MEIGSDQLKLVAFLSLIADRIQIWFEQHRWKMVACTSSSSAFKLLHTSPVFLHPGSPLLKFNTWHYQCYNWNEVARLFLPGAAFVSVALMVHLILSLPIMFLFLLLPPLLVEKQRLWLQKLFPLFSTNFNPACSLQCSASVFQCASMFEGCSVSVHRLHPLLLPSVHPCICTIPISRISDQPACISSSSSCISTLVLVHLLHTSASLAFVHLHRPALLPPLLRKAKLTARFFLILLQQMKRSQPLC